MLEIARDVRGPVSGLTRWNTDGLEIFVVTRREIIFNGLGSTADHSLKYVSGRLQSLRTSAAS